MCENKQEIINRFYKNVRTLFPDTSGSNKKHAGKEGHWLETKMGIIHNGDNEPDLFGYEMKNQTTSGKITFGDWTADEYIFLHGRGKNKINSINKEFQLTRDNFLTIFGKPNEKKGDRYSWSGIPCPTYFNDITAFGQHLTMDKNGNILIKYNFSKDTRDNKFELVHKNMQREGLILARWNKNSLKSKLEKKFNQKGWFTCLKDKEGKYSKISFGLPMNYETWIELFIQKVVFFDSGMYQGNNRPYSMWRAKTGYWHSLIQDSY